MHFSFSAFVRDLKDEKLSVDVGDVLQPRDPPLPFFTNVYIRDAYKKLWSLLLTNCEKQGNSLYFALILGSPGTGKSSFLCYALAMALHQQKFGSIIVSHKLGSGNSVFYVLNEGHSGMYKTYDIPPILTSKHSNTLLWLMDGMEHSPLSEISTSQGPKLVILTSSPDGKNYNEFKKRAQEFWLPPPGVRHSIRECKFSSDAGAVAVADGDAAIDNDEGAINDEDAIIIDDEEDAIYNELQEMYSKCYQQQYTLSECVSRFEIVGPNPRKIFGTKSATELKNEIDSFTSMNANDIISRSFDSNPLRYLLTEKKLSSTLFMPLVDDNFKLQNLTPSSDYVVQQCLVQYNKQHNAQMLQFLSKTPQEGMAIYWGHMFEAEVFRRLCSSEFTLDIMSLSNNTREDSLNTEGFTEIIFSDLKTALRGNLEQLENKFFRPAHKSYGAIDALFFKARDIWLLQVTRDIHHGINATELKKRVGEIPDTVRKGGSLKLLFIVPTDIVDKFEIQRYKTPAKSKLVNTIKFLQKNVCQFKTTIPMVPSFELK